MFLTTIFLAIWKSMCTALAGLGEPGNTYSLITLIDLIEHLQSQSRIYKMNEIGIVFFKLQTEMSVMLKKYHSNYYFLVKFSILCKDLSKFLKNYAKFSKIASP